MVCAVLVCFIIRFCVFSLPHCVSDTSLHSGIPTLYIVVCHHVSVPRKSNRNGHTERKIQIFKSRNYSKSFLFFDSVI